MKWVNLKFGVSLYIGQFGEEIYIDNDAFLRAFL